MGCKLSNSKMNFVKLENCNFSFVNFDDTIFEQLVAHKTTFDSCEMKGLNMENSNLIGIDLSYTNLSDTNLRFSNFTNALLSRANLSKSNMTNTFLINTKLEQTDLSDANLSGSFVEDTDLHEAILSDLTKMPKYFKRNLASEYDEKPFGKVDVDESKLPSTCYDFILQDDLDINEEMGNANFFVFVFPSKDDTDFQIVCKTHREIEKALTDKNGIFYECTGKFKKDTLPDGTVVELRDRKPGPINETPYVKILGIGGTNIFIDIKEINSLLNSSNRVYYVYPEKEITHSISWNNKFGEDPNYVSSYHCQYGSNLPVYTLKVCEGNCIISNRFIEDV
jgi:uncharacterized protein YjbI with pentapeptide repeats